MSDTADTSIRRSKGTKAGSERGDGDRDDGAPDAGGRAALDPEHERDQEERRDVEDVPLLDPQRMARGERGDQDEHQRREHAGAGEERPARASRARHEREEEQERGEREDAEREVELRHVPEEPAQHLHDVVRLLAGGAVGAEEVERRAAARKLRDERRAGPRRR